MNFTLTDDPTELLLPALCPPVEDKTTKVMSAISGIQLNNYILKVEDSINNQPTINDIS